MCLATKNVSQGELNSLYETEENIMKFSIE